MEASRALSKAQLPAGWVLRHDPVVASTQDLGRAAALADAGSRRVFATDAQTAGRGRAGRDWTAPAGSGLLLTILLREPACALLEHTMLTSVALCETLEALYGLQPRIKWPNDLLLGDRKVAGILAEVTDAAPGYVAVGLGLNVRWLGSRPPGVPPWATALDEHTVEAPNRMLILERLIGILDTWLQGMEAEIGHAELMAAWHRRLWRLNQAVKVRTHDGIVGGVLSGTDANGALRLSRDDGTELHLLDGELLMPARPVRG